MGEKKFKSTDKRGSKKGEKGRNEKQVNKRGRKKEEEGMGGLEEEVEEEGKRRVEKKEKL